MIEQGTPPFGKNNKKSVGKNVCIRTERKYLDIFKRFWWKPIFFVSYNLAAVLTLNVFGQHVFATVKVKKHKVYLPDFSINILHII